MNKKTKQKNLWISVFLLTYCLLTMVPFYFLVIRSFTPTIDAAEFRVTIPERRPLKLNSRLVDLSTVYSVDTRAFKREMGLKGYLKPNLTLEQIAEQYEIPEQKIITYLEPYVHYSGIYTVLNRGFYKSVFGTVVVAGMSVIIGGFLGIMTGTALAGFRRPWHMFIYNSYLLNMIIPPMMVILPQYLIMTRYLGLNDSYMAIILLNIKGGALSTMIFTSYIATIPKELKESVHMDGGNHFHYFIYILLPLMGTPFAVFASIMLPFFWNDLLHGLIFLSPERYTLPAFVASLSGSFTQNFEAIFTAVLASLLPILIVYILFQKMFAHSAMAGAVKG